jgi:hypothetical protein
MKKTIKYFSIGFTLLLALSACSDKFLEDKKNYDNAQSEIYNYYSGADARVQDLYSWCLPTVGDVSWRNPSMGNADMCSKATEEYAGLSDFVDPEIEMSAISQTNSVPDFFMGQQNNIQEAVYGRIRNINDAILGIQGGTLSEADKNFLLGQCYFFRGWCYYNLFKWYGGVPLVTDVKEPVEGNASFTPRSSAKSTKEFIENDLNTAAKLLGGKKMAGNDNYANPLYGRVSSGTALALKGRLLTLWCSPLFNRKNDQERWKTAYETMKEDLTVINNCGYGLYQSGSNLNGSDFSNIFVQSTFNPEAVFVTLYNQVVSDDGLDTQKNNNWERSIRPSNTGGGGKTASAMLINLFPMADGLLPSTMPDDNYTKLPRSTTYIYDENYPFMDRDPRFYHTFAFPGFRWAYSGDASLKDEHNPSDCPNYTLWNYVWFTDKDDLGNVESGNSYGADNLLSSKCGVYVRKKSDDLDMNTKPLYQYMATYSKGAAPFFSAAPLIELRYAEVLLNLAEVACGTGEADKIQEAAGYLKQVRDRAGVPMWPDLSDQATCMSAILYERQIEFAYEGKRFDDMRRWMLFDGGSLTDDFGNTIANAPSTWKLENWGANNNTCEWLGIKKFNGQIRTTTTYRVADKYGVGGKEYDSDPLKDVTRPAGIDLREVDITTQLHTLKTWYADNLTPRTSWSDGYYTNRELKKVNFRPQYYFLGLSSGAQSANKALPQTIGWEATYNEATFDPLAE